MLDFETKYDAFNGEMAKLETETRTFRDKASVALQGWRYWAPMVILATFAGHFV